MPRQILATQMLVAFNFCLQLEGENYHSLPPCTIPLPDSLPRSKLPAPFTPLLSVSQSWFSAKPSLLHQTRGDFSYPTLTISISSCCAPRRLHCKFHFFCLDTPLISSGPFATLSIFPHLSPFWLIPTCNILSTPIAFLLPPSLFLVLLPSISLLAVPWIKENVIMTV